VPPPVMPPAGLNVPRRAFRRYRRRTANTCPTVSSSKPIEAWPQPLFSELPIDAAVGLSAARAAERSGSTPTSAEGQSVAYASTTEPLLTHNMTSGTLFSSARWGLTASDLVVSVTTPTVEPRG
jgi:hypothetical protein